jgi:type IX secretion system PorP/SprF family membrane protein
MKKINYILTGALLLFSSALFSQQESIFTSYRYHMNMVNPAYAGIDNETILVSSIRKQWVGIKDAPETQAVSFGTNMKKNLGMGASLVSDKTFIETQVFFGIDFSYKVKLTATTDMYLGLKVGGNVYDVNTSGLETYLPNGANDPSLRSINNFNPNIGAGMVIKRGKFFYSLSVPRMLNTVRAKNQDGIATVATDRPHFYMSSGYDFDLNASKTLILKPSFMMRYVSGAPLSADINALLNMYKYVEIGATYRTDNAQTTGGYFPMNTYAAIFNLYISKKFSVGYMYEMNTRKQLASALNTNEFLLRFKF